MNKATCRYCGEEGVWSWNFQSKKSIIRVGNRFHRCEGGKKDIFPGWCDTCQRIDLLLIRTPNLFQLVESYGLPHTCTENGETDISDVSEGRCKHCNTTGLLWIYRTAGKFELWSPDGTRHCCPEYETYSKAWAEARREDYAFEKKWINSKPDDCVCSKCHGKTYIVRLSRNKRLMQKYCSTEPISVINPCKKCKGIGYFTPHKKKEYLKALRKKYWPFRPGIHKWKPNNDYDY